MMSPLMVFVLSCTLIYCIVMLRYAWAWHHEKENKLDGNYFPQVSIIISARNEQDKIIACLEGISKQKYPKEKFEIILVDDHSEDSTVVLAKEFLQKSSLNFQVLQLPSGTIGKKSAIIFGIEHAKGEIIITRDADTIINSIYWISSMVDAFQNEKTKMVVGPVSFIKNNSFLGNFQELENLGLQLIAGATVFLHQPVLCSGANLAYRKESFLAAGADVLKNTAASGDDVFLLHRFHELFLNGIVFSKNKNSIVNTSACTNFGALMQQRARWAGKFFMINSVSHYFLGIITALMNFSLLFSLISSFFFMEWCYILAVLAFSRFIIDYLLVFLSASFFGEKASLRWFISSFIFNPIYVLLVLAFSMLKKPVWKGRKTVGKKY